jgi:aspartyl-tRNA(Asn)/glutamyl-tRNA(Gln) amidotransferase subunit B
MSETVNTFEAQQQGRPTGPLVHGYEVIIGFETHAQLSTQSKIFSRASTAFGAEANTQACAVDLALPGTLPVMNKGAVERAIQFGRNFAFNFQIGDVPFHPNQAQDTGK